MNSLTTFVKYQRKKNGFTQEDLAAKAGVGLRFVRELEQGKQTLQLDKVEQVLNLFGFQLTPERQHLDPYFIFWNHFDKAVKITLKNRLIKAGIIIDEIIDKKENKISAWKFIANSNAIKYQQNEDETLIEIIPHDDIQKIEDQ